MLFRSHKSNIHGDADRHAERGDDVGGMVSRPDCIGGMVTSDPTPACGKGTHHALIKWAGTTSISMGSPPLTEQYRKRRLASSNVACRVRPVSLVHLVDLVCLVSLVHLVYPVNLVQPNKQDKPNKPNKRDQPDKPDRQDRQAREEPSSRSAAGIMP